MCLCLHLVENRLPTNCSAAVAGAAAFRKRISSLKWRNCSGSRYASLLISVLENANDQQQNENVIVIRFWFRDGF